MRKWHFSVAKMLRSQSSVYLISPLSNYFPLRDFYNLKKTRENKNKNKNFRPHG